MIVTVKFVGEGFATDQTIHGVKSATIVDGCYIVDSTYSTWIFPLRTVKSIQEQK